MVADESDVASITTKHNNDVKMLYSYRLHKIKVHDRASIWFSSYHLQRPNLIYKSRSSRSLGFHFHYRMWKIDPINLGYYKVNEHEGVVHNVDRFNQRVVHFIYLSCFPIFSYQENYITSICLR